MTIYSLTLPRTGEVFKTEVKTKPQQLLFVALQLLVKLEPLVEKMEHNETMKNDEVKMCCANSTYILSLVSTAVFEHEDEKKRKQIDIDPIFDKLLNVNREYGASVVARACAVCGNPQKELQNFLQIHKTQEGKIHTNARRVY